MAFTLDIQPGELDSPFKLFHELMAWKVTDILLVSTPYDAWVLEEDCRLSERVVSEYRGLNLSRPPRLTWVRSAREALDLLSRRSFDLVLTMSHLADMAPEDLGRQVKSRAPNLPVTVLFHQTVPSREMAGALPSHKDVDGVFVWSGDTDIVVALIKSTEDRRNAPNDTQLAGIRIILLVQSDPCRLSHLLPVLYREVVSQTQALIQSGLNEEERLLTMRARPKILMASTYEEAMDLFRRFEPYVLGVIADAAIGGGAAASGHAGADLLAAIQKARFDIPLLLMGTDEQHARRARELDAAYIDRQSPFLGSAVQDYFQQRLGFGDFVFRAGDGREIGSAHNLMTLADGIRKLSPEVYAHHSRHNDISRWLFAHTEIVLASKIRPLSFNDFEDLESQRRYIVKIIQQRRSQRQKGVVVDFDSREFDPEVRFLKLGNGSLGGKARGLAFLDHLLRHNGLFDDVHPKTAVAVPQTLVITTEFFETFIQANGLGFLAQTDESDQAIADRFLSASLPAPLVQALKAYLSHIRHPLAIRSSGLLEDAQQHAYAGLYHTYLVSNDHEDPERRLDHLLQAVKLVYASTFFQNARAYAQRVGHHTSDEKMAVIIQQLVGSAYGPFYYPAISGVALSLNYYPQGPMKPEDGVADIALGLGKSVVSGGQSLRFCPKYPKVIPQQNNVDDQLAYAQRHFYTLGLGRQPKLGVDDGVTLERRHLSDAVDEEPLRVLCSTYQPADHRIRDTSQIPGPKVLTFAAVLKHDVLPLAAILRRILEAGEASMGRPVEVEFAVELAHGPSALPGFALLQMRPMSARATAAEVDIPPDKIDKALCYSRQVMGNGVDRSLTDILFVKPHRFDTARTRDIARQVGELNRGLVQAGRRYLLVGPGRWGSQDPWLGIPVQWGDIDGVGAIVETTTEALNAELSQGAHFFHNLASLDIYYFCLTGRDPDRFDWDWLTDQPVQAQTVDVAHVALARPLDIKVDGRTSCGLISTGS